jgi:thiol-disulfide isomerase/thioredoxin
MKKLSVLFFIFFAMQNLLTAQRSSYKAAMASRVFADSSGNLHSLGDIIEQQKGKAVYLDFWATWCMPCLQSMPAAKSLAQNLKDLPISFVYIALDDNPVQWRAVIEKMGISASPTRFHYRAARREAEPVLAAFYAHAIPHYVIFDKSGRPVAPHATSPAEKATEKKLRKLAKAKGG